jgi:hypothetical protein
VRLRKGKTMSADFIYDDKRVIARIVNGEVFRDSDGKKIALVRNGTLYDVETDKVLGSLQLLGVSGAPIPDALKKLLS